MFRRRFWLTLLASIPVVVTSGMIMDWFGYNMALNAQLLRRVVLSSSD